MSEKMFPIMAQLSGKPVAPHPLTIPWSVAEKAYSVYAGQYGTGQSLARLAERGGFSAGEMDEYHPEWKEETRNLQLNAQWIDSLQRRVMALERCLREFPGRNCSEQEWNNWIADKDHQLSLSTVPLQGT